VRRIEQYGHPDASQNRSGRRDASKKKPGETIEMLQVEFIIKGKKVKPEEVRNRVERAILIEVERSLRQRAGSIRCGEHDASPRINASGPTADALEFDLSACCQDAIDRTVAALA
jgi:hypothetical protein